MPSLRAQANKKDLKMNIKDSHGSNCHSATHSSSSGGFQVQPFNYPRIKLRRLRHSTRGCGCCRPLMRGLQWRWSSCGGRGGALMRRLQRRSTALDSRGARRRRRAGRRLTHGATRRRMRRRMRSKAMRRRRKMRMRRKSMQGVMRIGRNLEIDV